MKSRYSSIVLATLLLPGAVFGGERLLLAGGEAGADSYYTYLGVVLPGPGRENGRGFLQRYWVDAFGYEYAGGPGTIKADAYGLEAALGYGTAFERGWVSAYLGLRHTDTDLRPDDPMAEARGGQTGLKVDVQGEWEIAPGWRGNAIASYAHQQRGYWTRGRLMRALTPSQSVGGEIVFAGNDESRSTALGLVFAMQPASLPFTVGLKAGYREESASEGAYIGIELGYSL